MIDNLSLMRPFKPPPALHNACGRPFEWNGVIYSPNYSNGTIRRYDAQIKNLRLFLYADRIYLVNSLHKYFHGNNYSDFHLCDFKNAVEKISDETGINWLSAAVKKIEYGANVQTNAEQIYKSLVSYKGKDYLPMTGEKEYGAACSLNDYRMKGYSKNFQVWKLERLRIAPTFRWEVSYNRLRAIEKKLNISAPLLLSHLQKKSSWQVLANDATEKFQNTIKMQRLNLHLLTAHEKRIIAEMLVPVIRDDLKKHNKETYKRDQRIYRRIMKDKSICIADNIGEGLKGKFEQLINSTSSL